ncbi:MAG TPA: hypothetical protein ENK60_05450 [Anaerolineae bacterium]|nr:hypothetical protein [Anaerolineae bacterium]
MKSSITKDFRKRFERLPKDVQRRAKRAFQRWQHDPFHPSLHFKRVSKTHPIYSVRIGSDYRALGLIKNGTIIWFWIGSHNEYDNLLRSL